MKDYILKINGHRYDVSINEVNDASTVANVTVNGISYTVDIEGGKALTGSKPQIAAAPKETGLSVAPQTANPTPKVGAVAPAGGHSIMCPLPGTVLSLKVKVGDTVSAGQTVAVIEAMKMENNIDADRSGKVSSIAVSEGATVAEGAVLLTID